MESDGEYVSLARVKEILDKEREERGELSYEQTQALEHAKKFAMLPSDQVKELIEKLSEMERVSIENAFKIADLMPETKQDLMTIFYRERFVLEQEEIDRILEIMAGYQ